MKYKIIKSRHQYNEYCKELKQLLTNRDKNKEDEIDMLTLLIEKWDEENLNFEKLDPVQLIKSLMEDHNLNSKDLGKILNLSKGTISKMMNYQKGLSKETIRLLANYFSVKQEVFNRPYKLKNAINRKFKNASLMNTKKKELELHPA